MKNGVLYFMIIIISINFTDCKKDSLFITMKSGNMQNDDIEEPLIDLAIKYKNILDSSNAIINLLMNKKYEEVYKNYLSTELKSQMIPKDFSMRFNYLQEKNGKIKSYKPMQWYFSFRKDNGRDIICSFKIVHHENAIIYYNLVYDINDYTKLIGFHFSTKK